MNSFALTPEQRKTVMMDLRDRALAECRQMGCNCQPAFELTDRGIGRYALPCWMTSHSDDCVLTQIDDDFYGDEIVNMDAVVDCGFYVSMRLEVGGKYALLMGPYDDYRLALANRGRAMRLTNERYPTHAPWYLYGTCKLARGATHKVEFGYG